MAPGSRRPSEPRLLGRTRVLGVAGQEAVPATFRRAPTDEQLPLGSGRHLLGPVVHHARLEAAPWPAESAHVDLARLDAVGVDAPRLGHAPYLDEREAEALLEGLVQFGLDAGAEAELHAVLSLLRRGGLGQQQRRRDTQGG